MSFREVSSDFRGALECFREVGGRFSGSGIFIGFTGF